MNSRYEKIRSIYHRVLQLGFRVESVDDNRPWGGFLVIDQAHIKKFIYQFYPESADELVSVSLPLSPKILCLAPGQKLSWQYHHRRSELWKLLEGKAAYRKSDTDKEGDIQIMELNKILTILQGERHCLIGLNEWAIIAEIWQHTDENNPSNEEDIVRLHDLYGRK